MNTWRPHLSPHLNQTKNIYTPLTLFDYCQYSAQLQVWHLQLNKSPFLHLRLNVRSALMADVDVYLPENTAEMALGQTPVGTVIIALH